jgi:hypothetical protein
MRKSGKSVRRHPTEPISNGIFDAPCGACESEMDQADEEWQYDPTNTTRTHCRMEPYLPAQPWDYVATCLDVEDKIPF